MSIGVSIAGGGPSANRQADDFYPTPDNVTKALLARWRPLGTDPVWEPCCGDGAISRVLESAGYTVVSTDLVDRGYGTGGQDFLKTTAAPAKRIVTNPPFNLSAQFIEHAFELGVEEMALLLKATYWHASKRYPLFRKHPPRMVMPLLWRPDFLNKGAPTMDVMWCVWDKRISPAPSAYVPIPRV